MLDTKRRLRTSTGSVALLLCSCGERPEEDPTLHELPPISWKGSYIEFGTDVDSVVCPQTLPLMDEYMGGVDEHVRSGTTYPIRYFHLRDDLTDYGFGCPEGSYGCVDRDAESLVVGSRQLSLRHELIHASSLGGQHHVIEEGLAVFLGTDLQWVGIAEPMDVRAAFESVEGSEAGLPADFYPVAGHFVSFLADEVIATTMAEHRIAHLQGIVDLRRDSVFDRAAAVSPVLELAEHYRSVPHLVEFPLSEFYRGRVDVMTHRPDTDTVDAIDVVVPSAPGRSTSTTSRTTRSAVPADRRRRRATSIRLWTGWVSPIPLLGSGGRRRI